MLNTVKGSSEGISIFKERFIPVLTPFATIEENINNAKKDKKISSEKTLFILTTINSPF